MEWRYQWNITKYHDKNACAQAAVRILRLLA